MIKLGIIYCSYGMPEYIDMSLNPWVKAKQKYNIEIAAVSGLFKEMYELGLEPEDKDIQTELSLGFYKNWGDLDYLYIQNPSIENYQNESQIRDKGLQFLLKQNVDYVLLIDSDEKWNKREIDNLFNYLENSDNQFYAYFRIEYKNLVFSDKTYITGFNPKRIWKTDYFNYKLNSVIYDNDMEYVDKNTNFKLRDDCLIVKQIPINLINPLHYSWNNFERSCLKIKYAEKRWNPPFGAGCSFKINEEKKCIEWNEEHFKLINKPIPEVYTLQEN